MEEERRVANAEIQRLRSLLMNQGVTPDQIMMTGQKRLRPDAVDGDGLPSLPLRSGGTGLPGLETLSGVAASRLGSGAPPSVGLPQALGETGKRVQRAPSQSAMPPTGMMSNFQLPGAGLPGMGAMAQQPMGPPAALLSTAMTLPQQVTPSIPQQQSQLQPQPRMSPKFSVLINDPILATAPESEPWNVTYVSSCCFEPVGTLTSCAATIRL